MGLVGTFDIPNCIDLAGWRDDMRAKEMLWCPACAWVPDPKADPKVEQKNFRCRNCGWRHGMNHSYFKWGAENNARNHKRR
jgi:hypothetical protein